jgi:hypothetical protein
MMQTNFAIPRTVAICPHCGGALYLEIDSWLADTGEPTSCGIHVSCENEPDWNEEPDGHWEQPYITLLPLEHKVYLWAKDHVRVAESEGELRAKMADFVAGKPMPGGMGL